MYRRDISSIIRFLSILLFLFILFQLWIKPAQFDSTQPQPTVSADPQLLINEYTSLPERRESLEGPQSRLIEPEDGPSAQLEQIRDDLDRGNYRQVETQLQKLPQQALAGEHAKHFAAALWNNLGVQQEKFSGFEVSVKAFKRAVALDPKNPVALLNLAQAYWGLHDNALTEEFLESVLRAAPNDAFSHIALADVLIEKGKVASAEQHLKSAQTQAKTDPYLAAYSQRLTGKLDPRNIVGRSEPAPASTQPAPISSPPIVPANTETQQPAAIAQQSSTDQTASAPSGATAGRKLAPRTMERFAIQFDGKPDPETAMRIRSILDYAHEDMSKKFGYTLSSTILVVLHTEQKFAAEAGSPVEADALYDAASSTIHLPLDGAMEDLAVLSRVLRHEFAHALIHDKMRTHIDQLPTWIAEGLAIQLAEDPWPALEEVKQKPFSLISLSLLEKRWDRSQRDKLDFAYVESIAAVQSLIDRFGIYGIRQIMNLLQSGQSLDAAMKQKWSVSYEEFQRGWEKTFTSSMAQGRENTLTNNLAH
jgi:tetratricopeptide (TPR) repeat protein